VQRCSGLTPAHTDLAGKGFVQVRGREGYETMESSAARPNLWLEAWRTAPNRPRALRYMLEYTALRLWGTLIGWFPVETNRRTARLLGHVWWWLMPRHRQRAMDNLRAALGGQRDEETLRRLARESFVHFTQLYLVEMVMTPRLVTEWSWTRYVELGELSEALRELLRPRGTILITAHFGNYELLGYAIARLGLPLTAVFRPLDDPLVTDYVMRTRKAGGVNLLIKRGAMRQAEPVLRSGEPLCFIADQDAGRKGVFSEFFGRKASWYKSIGLLAMYHRVPIVVGYAARTQRRFRYRLTVARIIRPEEWESQPDPLQWITDTYAQALEDAIRRYPEQYLWVHRRWKTRPPEERHQAFA